jgi:hypothetical protein
MAESEGNGKSYERMEELEVVMGAKMWRALGDEADKLDES